MFSLIFVESICFWFEYELVDSVSEENNKFVLESILVNGSL